MSMKCIRIGVVGLLLPLAGLSTGCVGGNYPPLEVVQSVDVERYMGLWHEIARYPNFFQSADCVATTAEYSLLEDGRVRVVNTCHEGGPEGPEERIEGTARVVDPETNAKLKVSFFPLVEGNYWIIDLDTEGYEWAVVGEPSRRFLWILSRTPTMDDELYEELTGRLPAKDYDPSRLIRTDGWAR